MLTNTMKMTLAQKTRWLDALRSGEYKQAKGNMKYTERSGVTKFCCLGVLEELEGTKSVKTTKGDWRFFATRTDCSCSVLTRRTASKYQSQENGPQIPGDLLTLREIQLVGICPTIAALNDGPADFNRIADLLDAVIIVVPDSE
jgi:hypothetical protein